MIEKEARRQLYISSAPISLHKTHAVNNHSRLQFLNLTSLYMCRSLNLHTSFKLISVIPIAVQDISSASFDTSTKNNGCSWIAFSMELSRWDRVFPSGSGTAPTDTARAASIWHPANIGSVGCQPPWYYGPSLCHAIHRRSCRTEVGQLFYLITENRIEPETRW